LPCCVLCAARPDPFRGRDQARVSPRVFGLIAEGWEIEDTTGKGTCGPLPPEAAEVESIVGLFDAERAGGQIWTVDEFNEFAAMKGSRELSFDEIVRVKKKRSELFQLWSAVEPGTTLELQYETTAVAI
jgi:hypothetical protein